MGIAERYLLRKSLKALVFAMPAAFFAVTLADAQPVWDAFSRGLINLWQLMIMLGLWMPMMIYLAMPAVAALSVGYVYAVAIQDREIAVLYAAGFGPRQLVRPAFAAGVFSLAVCAAMSLYLVPTSILEFKERMFLAEKNVGPATFRENRFTQVRPGLDFFYSHRLSDTDVRNAVVFLREPGGDTVIASKFATFVRADAHLNIVFLDGYLTRAPRGRGEPEVIGFKVYTQALTKIYSSADLGERGEGFFEQHIQRLLWPPRDPYRTREIEAAWLMEGYKRLVQPMLCVAYIMLAVAIAMLGLRRARADIGGTLLRLIGVLVVIDPLYQVALGALSRAPDIDGRIVFLYPLAVFAAGWYLVRADGRYRRSPLHEGDRAEPNFGDRRRRPAIG
ncbi:MAG: LptF/LptG family permease [Rhodospirillaceae bacterium]|nr:LptF/LptG family permease [Rhodospirillaceae bacterium]